MWRNVNEFPPSKAPRFAFAETLVKQENQLRRNPLLQRMREARRAKADDPHRPLYHYVNPEYALNDPNGLCFWQGRWHLFYQARPPEDPRQHWGHAVSPDLIHWRDLPYAIGPGPEDRCYSGTTLVEEDRVIAMYHGVGVGNMVAVSRDPLLLNWRKVTGRAVIPFGSADEPPLPYGVFDPCIWRKGGAYYALSAGIVPVRPGGKHMATNYLFRSRDLENWEYLHPFWEGDRFTRLGDDGACPYFWPLGDRHILVFFSHLSGSQYLIGDYDRARDKFVVDAHGLFTFGPVFPGGVHAPTAFPDGERGVIVMFNMNPATPTGRMDNYLSGFFGGTEGWLEEGDGSQFSRDWDQILTLPRRLTLRDRYQVDIEPAGDIASLRSDHRHIGRTVVTADREVVLEDIEGICIQRDRTEHRRQPEAFVPVRSRRFAVTEQGGVHAHLPLSQERLQVPGAVSGRRSFPQGDVHGPVDRGAIRERDHDRQLVFLDSARRAVERRVRLPITARVGAVPTVLVDRGAVRERDHDRQLVFLDSARCAVEAARVGARACRAGEPVRLRIFVDRSVVEVFVNGRQCVAVRVYPGRRDSTGVSLISRGQESEVLSLDCWQMRSIQGE